MLLLLTCNFLHVDDVYLDKRHVQVTHVVLTT